MVNEFIRNEDGQGLTEYMLVLSLVAVFLIVALTLFTLSLTDYYNDTVTNLPTPGK